MDADPKFLIAREPFSKAKFRSPIKLPSRRVIFGAVVIFLTLLTVAGLILIKSPLHQIILPKDEPQFAAKEDLEKTLKNTFDDPKDIDILNYISFASQDRSVETKFVDYSKAYQLIYQRYQNSSDLEVRTTLIRFRAFMRAFPDFKEANFPLPK